jgi:hypothetical protein
MSGCRLSYASLLVGNPQGILGKQLRPCPIQLLNIITILTIYVINYYIIKLKIKCGKISDNYI